MIDLLKTTHEFRLQLARKAEPFFLVYKKKTQFMSTYKKISEGVPEKYEKELWTLLSATTQAIRYNTNVVKLPMRSKRYSEANSHTKQNLSAKKMLELLTILEGSGYLTRYKGYSIEKTRSKGIIKAMQSCVQFHNSWLSMFDKELCKTHGTARTATNVILRDEKGNNISTKGKKGVTAVSLILCNWNRRIRSSEVTIDGVVVKNIVYSSVFNNSSMTCSGRFFAGSFTTELSDLRKTITIDGKRTVEVDIRGIHPRTLYTERGVLLDESFDPYEIVNDGWDKKESRDLAKKAMLIVLNSDSKKVALKSVTYELGAYISFDKDGRVVDNKDENVHISRRKYRTIPHNKGSAETVLRLLGEKNAPIESSFYKAEWGRLMHKDSLLLRHVIQTFCQSSSLVLTYHDSGVCSIENRELLIDTLREGWKIINGTYDNFEYTVEEGVLNNS